MSLDPRWERRIGYVLIANAAVGLVLAAAGLVGLWWFEPRIARSATEGLALARRTVDTTSGLLTGVDDAVRTGRDSMGTLRGTVANVAATLDTTAGLTQSASRIAGTDAAGIIRETSAALGAVEQTAELADRTLGLVASIPLIGQRYQPQVPLHEGVARVRRSLEPLPDSLATVQKDLAATSTNLTALRGDVQALEGSLADIERSLGTLAKATAEYRQIAGSLDADLAQLERTVPTALQLATLFGSAVMIWLAVAQLGLFTQGLERLRPRE
jgi:hypothetical protein